jgi:hypothetical protein
MIRSRRPPSRTYIGTSDKGGHDPALVVVPAGDEVGTQLWCGFEIGVAQQVHPDDPADVLVVDLDEAYKGSGSQEQDHRQDE